MHHTSYEKMAETAASWSTLLDRRGKSITAKKVKWVVTEKVHGANFCFHCDGNFIQYAKRRSILESNDAFFGYNHVAKKYSQSIRDMFKIINNDEKVKSKYFNPNNYYLSQISVYGELFGGYYPNTKHNDNPNEQKSNTNSNSTSKSKSNSKSANTNDTITTEIDEKKQDNDDDCQYIVQKEIFYSPKIEFYAFDIAIVTSKISDTVDSASDAIVSSEIESNKTEIKQKNHHGKGKGTANEIAKKTRNVGSGVSKEALEGEREYLDFEDCIVLFEECGIFYATPLFIGTLEKCLNYKLRFETNIPKWLNIKNSKLKGIDNFAEGIVIKSMKTLYVDNGKSKKNAKKVRAIVKHKDVSFRERILQSNNKQNNFDKYNKHNKYNKNKYSKNDNYNGKLNNDEMNIRYIIGMINKNRYYSVVSKIGNVKGSNKNSKKGGNYKSKGKNKQDLKIDANNVYVKGIIDDVIDDLTQENGMVDINNNVCLWWSQVVCKNTKLREKILRRMTEQAIVVVSSN